MCYQVVEIYSVCKCLYFQHAVDCCPSHGQPGHAVQIRTIQVGYCCSAHAAPAAAPCDSGPSSYADSGYHSHSSRSCGSDRRRAKE